MISLEFENFRNCQRVMEKCEHEIDLQRNEINENRDCICM